MCPQNNNISHIDDGQLPPGLQQFIAKRNPLASLSRHALLTSAHSLTKFYAQPSQLTELPPALLDLTNLQKLYIRQAHLQNMTLLSNLTAGLQELNLEGNRICDDKHIAAALQPHRHSLEYLGLIDNCLSEFPDLSQMLALRKLFYTDFSWA